MYSNQEQRTHTPESVLPREEDVHAYLLHHLTQVREIAGTRPASITLVADTYSKRAQIGWSAYIQGVPATSTQYPSAGQALNDVFERSCSVTARIAALRAEADELERGIQ